MIADEYLVEGCRVVFTTRVEAEARARELCACNKSLRLVYERRAVARCVCQDTGVRHRVASSAEFVGPLGWHNALRRTREACLKTTIENLE